MIKITKLNKYFYHRKSNEIHVINDVSLEFPQTGLVTIFGESGSGKTTLMNVVGGLDKFYSGTLEIDDFKITKYKSKKIDRIRNEKIGYIFQNYLLLQQRTVYENLKIVLNMYDLKEEEKNERIDYVLKAVGMLKYKKKNVSELSGGQQQRVAIARALIKSPSMILADEPTGNLDEKNTIQIMNIIKKISKNTLVILVSHEKNIATSYSDYIIEVCDGKIANKQFQDGNNKYRYEDDQNLYLKEYRYQNISSENVSIDFYSNEDVKVNFQIVYENGKFYVKSSNNMVQINDESEVKFVDDYKKELDANKEILENDYELPSIKYSKNPKLSFKEQVKLARTNLSKLRKRTAFLVFPLFIIIVLTLLSTQSIVSKSQINRQELVYTDSHIFSVKIDKGSAQMNSEVSEYAFKHFYEGLFTEHPNLEPVMDTSVELDYMLPNFDQIKEATYKLKGFSLINNEQLKESDIIYGRMPDKAHEIVVEKWVLENALKDSVVSNFMNVKSFINKEVKISGYTYSYEIVGIADTDENSIYFDGWALLDIYPSDLKKEAYNLCSVSQFEKYVGKSFSELGYTLNKGEALSTYYNHYKGQELLLNRDYTLPFIVKYKDIIEECPFNFIVNDDEFEEIKKSALATYFDNFNLKVYCENEKERNQVINYVNKVKDDYANEVFVAPSEIVADKHELNFLLSTTYEYEAKLAPITEQMQKDIRNRLLITFTILAISVIVVFFSMKSFSIKNIYDIGVYRALGIKKSSIVFIYAIEIFIISLKTTFIGGFLCYSVTNILASIPVLSITTPMSFSLFAITTTALIALNVVVGILPVVMYMRLTPSQLLTKYDI